MPEFKRPESVADLAVNFAQVKPYMNATMALQESARCLFCYDAPCVEACPTQIDIPLFIRQIHTGNVEGAALTIYNSNYFGNVCGKVCPTEVLCEGACVYNHQDAKPIDIGRLQSYAASSILESQAPLYSPGPSNGKKVAIIGAGPAGISCACELRRLGFEVDVFEAKERPSGLALYGCAPYKVTNEEVLAEVAWLESQFGFQIHYQHSVHEADQWRDMEAKYDAIFLGFGLGGVQLPSIPGESLPNVYSAIDYIARIKLDPLFAPVGKKVVVVGGGNTAMDAASESARMGAEEVILAYRRSKHEMRAYDFEYELAKSVGVQGWFNVAPVAILGENAVRGMRMVKTKVQDGQVVEIEGSSFEIPCDTVVLATGQEKMLNLLTRIGGIETHKNGAIKVDPETRQTTNNRYFAGGDAVNGGAEVVHAVAEGKAAAKGIYRYLLH